MTTTQNPVIPAKAGIQTFKFQPFPINSCYFSFLDSAFAGMMNDGVKVTRNPKSIPPGFLPIGMAFCFKPP
ncbi:hypothetical protein BWZ28_03785 [Neisseria meningitidis]|nr:hypothetical protein BWZ28_03785 [Neisseria meningitidis]